MLFDTHIHLNDEQFDNDLVEVLARAKDTNVNAMCIIGWDKNSSIKAIEICEKYSSDELKLYPAVGLHPENVRENDDQELNWLKELLNNHKKIVAVGEIGLDLYWDKSYTDLQIEYFEKQMEIATIYNKNVIIHSREATQITFDILKKYNVKGIFHCYSGSYEMAKEIIKIGYKLGIGGVLTYKNSKLPEVIEKIDLDYLVSETDAPYLSPVPYRGKRNESSYMVETVKKISEIKNMNLDSVEDILYNNAYEILCIEE